MRSPIHALAGHLMWTRAGTVWAIWKITPIAYGFRPDKEKAQVRALHQALIRALPGESLWLGISAGMNPAAVVEKMIAGVDLEQCTDWAEECAATLDTLDEIGIGQRVHWLAVPLNNTSRRERGAEPLRATAATFRDVLGLPRESVSPTEISRRQAQAQAAIESVPRPFRPVPATPAQVLWLHAHAQQRGLFADTSLPELGDVTDEALWAPRAGGALAEPLLDQGGMTDLATTRERRTSNPLTRRYLKVLQPSVPGEIPPASYQSLMVLSDVPDEGIVFPGLEFLGRVDDCGLEVDWAMRLRVVASSEVSKANKKALNSLNDQFGQREGELGFGMGTLERAAQDLTEYAQILDSDKLEVETQSTIMFCVAGPTAEAATSAAHQFSDYMRDDGFKLAQPLGSQEELWWAMTPGAPATRVVRDFAQITTSRSLSATVPFTSTDLGDSSGPLLGINISSGSVGAVLHDMALASGRDTSGSIALIAEKGGGKSLTMQTLAGAVVDRGGRIISVDRTPAGEWADWARSVTRATVASVTEPTMSLDPLRLFGTGEGARAAQTFLAMLLQVDPTDAQGVLLSEVLDPRYLHEHELTSLGQLPSHLIEDCDIEGARDLGRLMNVFAKKDIGRCVFDTSLPLLDTATPAIIIRTHGLELPAEHELLNEHLMKAISLEKRMGRSVYALLGALARRICFADLTQLAVYFVDEAHHQTRSSEGIGELLDFLRDDRKHNAAVVLGSHDAQKDLGDETLRGLVPTRILMRHRDATLARRGLEWLGMNPNDEDLVDIVTKETSPVTVNGVEEHRRGECFLRDSSGRIGRVKILAPSVPARNAAVRSTPPEVRDGAEGAGASS